MKSNLTVGEIPIGEWANSDQEKANTFPTDLAEPFIPKDSHPGNKVTRKYNYFEGCKYLFQLKPLKPKEVRQEIRKNLGSYS